MDEEKRATLAEVDEVTSVLNMRMATLPSHHLKAFATDSEIVDALLLQHIGVG